jgi:hypothetical protein
MLKSVVFFVLFFFSTSFAFQENAPILIQAIDTVLVTPAKPTANDSLVLNVRGTSHCCCTQLHNKKITVNDSSITLFASYDDANCQQCDCLGGFNAFFSCEPLKAGKYKIFYSEDLYCPPGKICAAIAMMVKNVQIGDIVVKSAAVNTIPGIDSKKYRQKPIRSAVSYSSSERKLILRIQKPQYVAVTAYIVNGEASTQFSSRKYLQAGVHSFHMDKERFTSGVAVIHVQGENFSEVKMINFAK